jgi:hypothetical protein
MRYQEAYEIIDAGLVKAALAFPTAEPLKAQFFDSKVQEIGMRTVKKKDSETFTTTATRTYTFTNANASDQIYKVEYDTSVIPFVSESRVNTNVADDDVSQIGYYVKDDNSQSGVITAGTSANPIAMSSAAHGLSDGDFVFIEGIVGLRPSTGELSEINGRIFAVTNTGTNTFTIAVNGTGGVAYASGGTWSLRNKNIIFNKQTDAAKTLKVYYYAKPLVKSNATSSVDLPDQLVPSAIHYTLGHFLALDGQLQTSSGHRGMAKQIEDEYTHTVSQREANYDIIPVPLQDFIY